MSSADGFAVFGVGVSQPRTRVHQREMNPCVSALGFGVGFAVGGVVGFASGAFAAVDADGAVVASSADSFAVSVFAGTPAGAPFTAGACTAGTPFAAGVTGADKVRVSEPGTVGASEIFVGCGFSTVGAATPACGSSARESTGGNSGVFERAHSFPIKISFRGAPTKSPRRSSDSSVSFGSPRSVG